MDIEEGLPVEVPLVYFYGHTTPSDHPELYKALVDRLGQLLDDRAKSSPQVHAQKSLLMLRMSLYVQSVVSLFPHADSCSSLVCLTLMFACVPSCLAGLQ